MFVSILGFLSGIGEVIIKMLEIITPVNFPYFVVIILFLILAVAGRWVASKLITTFENSMKSVTDVMQEIFENLKYDRKELFGAIHDMNEKLINKINESNDKMTDALDNNYDALDRLACMLQIFVKLQERESPKFGVVIEDILKKDKAEVKHGSK